MLSILRNQRLNGKMPFYLHSRGVPVAHKTGEDDGITHDVGIIYQDDPVIFCFVQRYGGAPGGARHPGNRRHAVSRRGCTQRPPAPAVTG